MAWRTGPSLCSQAYQARSAASCEALGKPPSPAACPGSGTTTRPPAGLKATLPARYRYLLPLADPFLGRGISLNLFQAAPEALGQPG